MDAVIEYLEKVDPKDAKIAKKRYGNFERFQGEAHAYGKAAAFGLSRSFEKEALAMLVDLRKNEEQYLKGAGGLIDGDELFYTQVNAEIVKNAEEYYRKMYHANESTWNLRDKHMVDVVSSLLTFHRNKFPGRKEKVVIWAHNSHLGDARATDSAKRRELNVGQLVREQQGSNCFNIGFSTYTGSVTAADDWDEPEKRKKVRPGMKGSWERLFHDVGEQMFILDFRKDQKLALELNNHGPLLERAIGVIYRPETERYSHYFYAQVAKQFDAMIHIEETRAVEPLEVSPTWHRATHEEVETYPSGL